MGNTRHKMEVWELLEKIEGDWEIDFVNNLGEVLTTINKDMAINWIGINNEIQPFQVLSFEPKHEGKYTWTNIVAIGDIADYENLSNELSACGKNVDWYNDIENGDLD